MQVETLVKFECRIFTLQKQRNKYYFEQWITFTANSQKKQSQNVYNSDTLN